MNENIDLTKILKNCPKGFRLYSIVHGEVSFFAIENGRYPICVLTDNNSTAYYSSNGKIYVTRGECVLFPSKDQRDWNKFTAPWYKHEEMKENIEPNKKEKFDPKIFQPFDKVIIRHDACSEWEVSLFSHRNTYYGIDELYSFCTVTNRCVVDCIPYNDETKHIVGTTDAAPDFYRYWED